MSVTFPLMLVEKYTPQIPDDLEVGYVPLSMGGAYPGLYLFTSPSRFVRPVKNISIPAVEGQNIELIGPFEQVSTVFRIKFPTLIRITFYYFSASIKGPCFSCGTNSMIDYLISMCHIRFSWK